MLQDEIRELAGELQKFSSDNKDNQKRITSLSKELYAICAISTKINQSMDVRKVASKIDYETKRDVQSFHGTGLSQKLRPIKT
jgi:hypothetical protein